MTTKKYEITGLSQGGIADNIISQIVGIYDSLDDAREQIPDDWVMDYDTDADQNGEVYYPAGTSDEEMDGYGGLVNIHVIA